MIAFANGSEFGNRFKIDPEGDARDGQFSLITVKKPPFFKLIPLLIDGFRGQLKESYYYRKQSLQELTISSPGATLHRDGEVSETATANSLHLKILPQSLRVIY
jgi:diacylglycerol kinase family enzyme